jgi:hypothetical protein
MPSIEIYRVRIDPAHAERLLEIRAAAVAEFRDQVPELLSADLVRPADDVWLDTPPGLCVDELGADHVADARPVPLPAPAPRRAARAREGGVGPAHTNLISAARRDPTATGGPGELACIALAPAPRVGAQVHCHAGAGGRRAAGQRSSNSGVPAPVST